MKHSLILTGILAAMPSVAASPPVISGIGPSPALVNTPYTFTPQVTDPDTAPANLRFVIQNRPSWLTFSYQTGKISGTPSASDVGVYSNIRIFVKDNKYTVGTKPFAIAVILPVKGTATISWNASVSPNIKGYRLYYGKSADALTQTIDTASPNVRRVLVDNLDAGVWYFAVKAYDAENESGFSPKASKAI